MNNPTAAILVIGDEILSGRTQDTNTNFLAKELTAAGIDLKEVRVVSDDHDAIVDAVNALRNAHGTVFTSGGIGPTHDDITADCIAAAFGVNIDVRADAREILEARYKKMGTQINEARLRMARIPDGATLIDNPVSGAPGFTIGNVHVMAGVPSVFKAMVESIVPAMASGQPIISQTLRVDHGEGDVAAPLAKLAATFPDVSIGSYPFQLQGAYGTNIVIRGHDAECVAEAMGELVKLYPENAA
jgi:molybdenum cofactor synthesis domain-containing protein